VNSVFTASAKLLAGAKERLHRAPSTSMSSGPLPATVYVITVPSADLAILMGDSCLGQSAVAPDAVLTART
jgi:hypothetical protein